MDTIYALIVMVSANGEVGALMSIVNSQTCETVIKTTVDSIPLFGGQVLKGQCGNSIAVKATLDDYRCTFSDVEDSVYTYTCVGKKKTVRSTL